MVGRCVKFLGSTTLAAPTLAAPALSAPTFAAPTLTAPTLAASGVNFQKFVLQSNLPSNILKLALKSIARA